MSDHDETRNTWDDPKIVNDDRINHLDPRIRDAAERIHTNESMHRHDYAGRVCVYCALNAATAIGVFDGWTVSLHTSVVSDEPASVTLHHGDVLVFEGVEKAALMKLASPVGGLL